MSQHQLQRWFATEHLPASLADIVTMYRDLVVRLLAHTAPGSEQTTAIRKLLESKDAAVRARIELGESLTSLPDQSKSNYSSAKAGEDALARVFGNPSA